MKIIGILPRIVGRGELSYSVWVPLVHLSKILYHLVEHSLYNLLTLQYKLNSGLWLFKRRNALGNLEFKYDNLINC